MNINTIRILNKLGRMEAELQKPMIELASQLEMATLKILEAESNVTLEIVVKTCMAVMINKDTLLKGLVVCSAEDRQEYDGEDKDKVVVLSKLPRTMMAFSQAVIDVAGEHNLFEITEKRLVKAVYKVLDMFKQEGKVLKENGQKQTTNPEAKSGILPPTGLSLPSDDAGVKTNLKRSAQEDPGTSKESKKLAETTDEDIESPRKAREPEVSQK